MSCKKEELLRAIQTYYYLLSELDSLKTHIVECMTKTGNKNFKISTLDNRSLETQQIFGILKQFLGE